MGACHHHPQSGLTQPPRGRGSARVTLRPQHLPPAALWPGLWGRAVSGTSGQRGRAVSGTSGQRGSCVPRPCTLGHWDRGGARGRGSLAWASVLGPRAQHGGADRVMTLGGGEASTSLQRGAGEPGGCGLFGPQVWGVATGLVVVGGLPSCSPCARVVNGGVCVWRPSSGGGREVGRVHVPLLHLTGALSAAGPAWQGLGPGARSISPPGPGAVSSGAGCTVDILQTPSQLEWTALAVALGGTQCPERLAAAASSPAAASAPRAPVARPGCVSPLGLAGTAAGEGPARSQPRPRGPWFPRCFGARLNAD